MTTLRKAAQQALEALETAHGTVTETDWKIDYSKEIAALRAALAEPVQEPVAWMHTNAVGHVYFRKKPQDKVFNPQPVYAIPSRQKCQYPDCVDNSPDGKCIRWLLAECAKSEDFQK